MSAKQYEKQLVNASNARYEQGIAHAYVSGTYVWEGVSEDRIAYHTGDGIGRGTGNHEYYGIEVCQSFSASNKEFLKNEQSVFQFIANKLNKWGLPANRNTVRLHNEFIRTECPHRSADLHAGMNTKVDAYTKARQLKIKDYFIKQIRQYMNGKVPVATVSKKSPASSNTIKPIGGSWKTNKYGTYYKNENYTFTVGNVPIRARIGSPFRTANEGGLLQPGQSITYNTVCLQDGHVWVEYTSYEGYDMFLPIREWNGKAPGTSNYSVGSLWGIIS